VGPLRATAIAASLAAMLALGSLAGAQPPSLAEQQARLRAADSAAQAARTRSRALEAQAANARDRAAQAQAREAAAAERIRASEADIAAAQARIVIVDRLLAAQRRRVAAQQGPIVRLIAALQSMARRPPALALVQPGSLEDMVHVRAVLGTAMPVVAARTAGVRAELARTRQLRASAGAAVATLRASRTTLESERVALVKLEAEHRLRSRALGQSALVESDRALALGERARDIVDQMETSGAAAEVQAELAALPGPLPRPSQAGTPPAATGRPPYRLPVAGEIVTGLGELSRNGVRARGITLACAANAPIVAPAAGKVVYAGPFRGYGGVVILDHGKGWTTLVAGLGAVGVRVGAQLPQGGALGRAQGGEDPRITVELRRRNQPMDLMQLLY
jgi:murein hydrolase activator